VGEKVGFPEAKADVLSRKSIPSINRHLAGPLVYVISAELETSMRVEPRSSDWKYLVNKKLGKREMTLKICSSNLANKETRMTFGIFQ